MPRHSSAPRAAGLPLAPPHVTSAAPTRLSAGTDASPEQVRHHARPNQRALDGDSRPTGSHPKDATNCTAPVQALASPSSPIRRLPRSTSPPPSSGGSRRVRASCTARIATAARWLWSPRPSRSARVRARGRARHRRRVFASFTCRLFRRRCATTSGTAAPPRVLVQFRLGDARAHEVALVGDFNGWHPEHRLHQVEPGVWSVDVALEPGVYNYVFVIDGKPGGSTRSRRG